MYRLSRTSLKNLEGVNEDLVRLMLRSIENSPVDFMVVEGLRSKERQQELYKKRPRVTQVDGLVRKSKHQVGRAVDICPWWDGKLQWNDRSAFYEISGHIKRMAKVMGIKIVWGGDWKTLIDLPHYELGK